MPLILGTNSIKDTGFNVDNSLRFNSGSSDYLNNTSVDPVTNRLKFTISLWVKRSTLGAKSMIGTVGGDSTNFGAIWFDSSDRLNCTEGSGGGTLNFITNRVFRDVSAWYNIILAIDTTQGTESNRVKIYVNGVQETSFSTSTYPGQNSNMHLNRGGKTQYIGRHTDSSNNYYFDGYMTEVVWVDGQQLSNTDLGEFDEDSGIWKPIDVSGLTFGNNGFYLDFESSGSLGSDVSGNSNNFTVNNLTAIDQSTDTCTNNSAVLNNLIYGANYSFSEGNLQFAQSASNWDTTYSSIGVTKGKWYMEYKGKVGAYHDIGVTDVITPTTNPSVSTGGVAWKSNSEFAQGGNVGGGLPSNVTSPASNTYTADDIIGIALDVDNEAVYFAKNGVWEVNSDPTSGASKTGAVTLPNSNSTYFFAFAAYKGSAASGTGQVNFGGGSVDAISSGNTDGNGYGNMEFEIPSGYYVLNTKNLAEYG